jgi:hypothetical protein
VSAEDTQEKSSSTIKFGGGFDSPSFTSRGTPARIKKELVDAAGIEDAASKTLFEVITEAGATASGLFTAAIHLGPGQRQRSESLPSQTTEEFRSSIADKAKAAQKSDSTDEDEALILGLISEAKSRKELPEIRDAYKDKWNEAHQKAASKRWGELEGSE